MAAPNIVNVTSILGKTAVVDLTTTSATAIISNAASSGKVFKVVRRDANRGQPGARQGAAYDIDELAMGSVHKSHHDGVGFAAQRNQSELLNHLCGK